MSKTIIEAAIDINTSADKVWRVFTDPSVSRQMGGAYITDWQKGSTISWQGLDGTLYTNGTILDIRPGKLLQHNLYGTDGLSVLSVITYTFETHKAHTTLSAREVLSKAVPTEEYVNMLEGWHTALELLKSLAEKL